MRRMMRNNKLLACCFFFISSSPCADSVRVLPFAARVHYAPFGRANPATQCHELAQGAAAAAALERVLPVVQAANSIALAASTLQSFALSHRTRTSHHNDVAASPMGAEPHNLSSQVGHNQAFALSIPHT